MNVGSLPISGLYNLYICFTRTCSGGLYTLEQCRRRGHIVWGALWWHMERELHSVPDGGAIGAGSQRRAWCHRHATAAQYHRDCGRPGAAAIDEEEAIQEPQSIRSRARCRNYTDWSLLCLRNHVVVLVFLLSILVILIKALSHYI